jgi:hypothetical protein
MNQPIRSREELVTWIDSCVLGTSRAHLNAPSEIGSLRRPRTTSWSELIPRIDSFVAGTVRGATKLRPSRAGIVNIERLVPERRL